MFGRNLLSLKFYRASCPRLTEPGDYKSKQRLYRCQTGVQRDRDVHGGYLHQLRAALLRARGGGVARLRVAAAYALGGAARAPALRPVRAPRRAMFAHL